MRYRATVDRHRDYWRFQRFQMLLGSASYSGYFNAFSPRSTECGWRLKTSQLPKFQCHLFGTFFGRNHVKSQVAKMDLSKLRPSITELL